MHDVSRSLFIIPTHVSGPACFICLIQFSTANDSELEGYYRERGTKKRLLVENPLNPFKQHGRGSLQDALPSIANTRWMLFKQETGQLGRETTTLQMHGLNSYV